ncbi:hypothetical protein HBB16_19565 [Pseudonocardia sp. MCCB 268]|nr:hypothetical protein [Pseudonocardia cytotoxica]
MPPADTPPATPGTDQLVQQERAAPAQVVSARRLSSPDRPVRPPPGRGSHWCCITVVQLGQLDAGRRDRSATKYSASTAGPHGGHHRDRAAGGEVPHQRGRTGVQQVRVVDWRARPAGGQSPRRWARRRQHGREVAACATGIGRKGERAERGSTPSPGWRPRDAPRHRLRPPARFDQRLVSAPPWPHR